MPHIIRKPGFLGGTTLAVFMTLVHTVNDAITAILGALLPTLQVRFDTGPTALALMVAVFWIASSVTQPVFGALGEDVGLRLIGCVGVLMASTFLSLIGVASELWLVFVLLVIGGLGSAALHPIGTTIAGSQATKQHSGSVSSPPVAWWASRSGPSSSCTSSPHTELRQRFGSPGRGSSSAPL